MSDKSWEPEHSHSLSHSLTFTLSLSHSFTLLFTHSRHAEQLLFSCLCSKVTLSLSNSRTLTHSHSLIHSLSRHAEQLLFSCLCSKVTPSISPSRTLTLSHSPILSFSHSHSLDMLNNFCFHVYAHKSLFIAENCNAFFLTTSSPSPVTLEFIELVPS